MAQSITVNIAGTDYPLVAETPEKERVTRLAAEDINSMLAAYDRKFPDRPLSDKLAFVALSETVAKLNSQGRYISLEEDAKALEKELHSYLEGK